ncbi:ribonuclease H-like domain-containing protein [Tanacetum coccineum]
MSGTQDEIPPPPPPPPSSPQTPTQQTPHTEVIQNGNSPVSITTDTQGQIKVLPPRTAEEIIAREIERKVRTTLLMALPEDHLAKFHKMTNANEMWDGIKSRFGGNDESKKMQKYILKQQFEGFFVSNTEGLHKGYDRFQSLLSQLEIHRAGVSTEDANQKFLRSLPSAWAFLARECRIKGTQDNRRRDAWNSGNKDRSRTVQKEDSKALVRVDGEGVDWTNHSEDEDYAYGLQHLFPRPFRHKSIFMNKESDIENQPVYDRFTEGMHAVHPPMTGNYIPSGPEIEIDYSQFTYGPKQTQPSESKSQSSDSDTCSKNQDELRWDCVSIPTKTTRKYLDYPHRALKNKGIVDSGCSRHMTRNKAYLAEFQDFNGGPVAFGGSKGYITGKGGLACLIAKATTDESNKWHRRLGHVNFKNLNKLVKGNLIENQLNQKVKTIRSDNGTEFKNKDVIEFCGLKGIKREYSNARTPQQNGVAERKNMTLIEAARTMLAVHFLP